MKQILVTLSVPDENLENDKSFADSLRYYLNRTKVLGCEVESIFIVDKVSD